MGRNEKDGVVNDYQLALISKSVFDIGPRCRVVIFMFGLIGIAMAFMASLVSHKQVPLDKIIHFSGYFILSATFVLALPGVLYFRADGIDRHEYRDRVLTALYRPFV